MIRNEELYDAAEKFSDDYKYSGDVDYMSVKIAFIEGAEWSNRNHDLSSLWHDVSEEPKCKELLIVYYDDMGGIPIDALIYHGYSGCPWEKLVKRYNFVYWAYAKDILPKRGTK